MSNETNFVVQLSGKFIATASFIKNCEGFILVLSWPWSSGLQPTPDLEPCPGPGALAFSPLLTWSRRPQRTAVLKSRSRSFSEGAGAVARAGRPFLKGARAQSLEPVKKGTSSKTLADSSVGGVNYIV